MANIVSVGDLALGAPVVGSAGESVGSINEVIEHPDAPPNSPASFYIEVVHGGVLGIGGQHLYIPVGLVTGVRDDGTVALSCTAREAAEKYTQEPQ